MSTDIGKLKEILVTGGYVSKADFDSAELYVNEHNVPIEDYLLSNSIITKDLLGQAVAEYLKVPYADLNSAEIPKEQFSRISESVGRENRVVLFSDDGKGTVVVTTDNPKATGLRTKLKTALPKAKVIQLAYSLSEDIDSYLVQYQKPLATRFSKIIEKQGKIAPEVLEEIFEDAFIYNASDIHFEPRKEEVVVRFRVDSVLQEAGRIPKEYYENILNRVKVKSQLRIDEHLAPQDGSLRFEGEKKSFDVRTSIVPTVEGEKIALRVLSSYVQGLGLTDLGLSARDKDLLSRAAKMPFGMILSVGPTGSGKTTTLYSLIRMLNQPNVNITTIEDPVEYKVVGINQIQVNKATGLTFAGGLRSIVRQDPDVILVGEIRDVETAEIGVNAALTGHLVCSTFHANDAATAIPRLLDMGAEPFLLASTIEVIVAQRLVRRICDTCKYSVSTTGVDLDKEFGAVSKYFNDTKITVYKGKGCNTCNGTGYKGQIAIFEIIEITKEMQDLILKNPSSNEIWKIARAQGSKPLFEDGIEKVKSGITTMGELFRVAQPPEF